MINISAYWITVAIILFLLFVLFAREVYQLSCLPRAHRERPLLMFNAGCLMVFLIAFVVVAGMVDGRRVLLEAELPPYPFARYAHEYSGLSDAGTQVYVTRHHPTWVWAHYQTISREEQYAFEMDDASQVMRITTRQGVRFIAVTPMADHVRIHITKEGIRATSSPSVP